MKILKSTDAIYREKPEGANVRYYLFDNYEVHYNEQAGNTTQLWHHHNYIKETLYIIDGELNAKWRENGRDFTETVRAGDLIEVEKTPHTFCNATNKIVRFIVIKRVSNSDNQREILKNDKVLDE